MRSQEVIAMAGELRQNVRSKASLAILDDVSALGARVSELMEFLRTKENALVLDASELSPDLLKLLPDEEMTPIAGGGVLTFGLLRRAGLDKDPAGIVEASREYVFDPAAKRVLPRVKEVKMFKEQVRGPTVLIDDVVASGMTAAACAELLWRRGIGVDGVGALLMSGTVRSDDRYRKKEGSTLPFTDLACAPYIVEGLAGRKPPIYSLRYLLMANYEDRFRFAGKQIKSGDAGTFMELMNRIERPKLLRLLRKDPDSFIRRLC